RRSTRELSRDLATTLLASGPLPPVRRSYLTNNAPALSRALTMIGALMILAGLGWGIWRLASAPPPPTISDAGAVVVAVTARVERVPAIATITPTAPNVPRFMP